MDYLFIDFSADILLEEKPVRLGIRFDETGNDKLVFFISETNFGFFPGMAISENHFPYLYLVFEDGDYVNIPLESYIQKADGKENGYQVDFYSVFSEAGYHLDLEATLEAKPRPLFFPQYQVDGCMGMYPTLSIFQYSHFRVEGKKVVYYPVMKGLNRVEVYTKKAYREYKDAKPGSGVQWIGLSMRSATDPCADVLDTWFVADFQFGPMKKEYFAKILDEWLNFNQMIKFYFRQEKEGKEFIYSFTFTKENKEQHEEMLALTTKDLRNTYVKLEMLESEYLAYFRWENEGGVWDIV